MAIGIEAVSMVLINAHYTTGIIYVSQFGKIWLLFSIEDIRVGISKVSLEWILTYASMVLSCSQDFADLDLQTNASKFSSYNWMPFILKMGYLIKKLFW